MQLPHKARTLDELQAAVQHFERELLKNLQSGAISETDAAEIYRKFQGMTESEARKLIKQQKTHEGSIVEKLIRKFNDTAFTMKYGFKNAVYKIKYSFKNRRTLEMMQGLSIQDIRAKFAERNYICGDDVATAVWLSLQQKKPLLLEGEAGCGKTEIAKVLADLLEAELIRLQCYDGLDENKALYEWNYAKQLLVLQSKGATKSDIFGDEFLMERPLLKAIRSEKMPVLLIDEVDKTDEEFEAFLLEILSDYQVSIPELGTMQAVQIPPVILTSNGVRDLGDPLKRRCIYLHIDYPSVELEAEILTKKASGISPEIAADLARAMQNIRKNLKLRKNPSISESIDLAQVLVKIDAPKINGQLLDHLTTLFLKNHDDRLRYKSAGGGVWALKRQ